MCIRDRICEILTICLDEVYRIHRHFIYKDVTHPLASFQFIKTKFVSDFLYQEAFLTTYRTFLTPLDLIEKLCRRHERFSCASDTAKQRAAREAFSLLVRVVSDLT